MSEIKKCCMSCRKYVLCHNAVDSEVMFCFAYEERKQTRKIKLYAHLVEDCFGKKLEWYDIVMTANAKEVKTNYEIIGVPSEDKEVEI
jgi:hypothetical protein